jgi:hypothetical protein
MMANLFLPVKAAKILEKSHRRSPNESGGKREKFALESGNKRGVEKIMVKST